MPTAYLSLGSNLGDRRAHLAAAIAALALDPHIQNLAFSPIFETRPVGFADQPWFLNQVVCFETSLTPHELLDVCLAIENSRDRVRIKRWGPRTLDLDILLYGDTMLSDDRLTIPHPRLLERAFVLAPLCDLAPDLLISDEPVSLHLSRTDQIGVFRVA